MKFHFKKYFPLYLLMTPTFILIITFNYYPAFSAIHMSFYEWDGGLTQEYIGMANFREAFFRDPLFWKSFRLVTILMAANIFKMIPAIVTAVAVHRLASERSRYFYRVLFVIPMIIPGIVHLLIWKSFYDPTTGILNRALSATGMMEALRWLDINWLHWNAFITGHPAWLGHTKLVVPSIIFWGFPWVGVVGVLIYLAGLQNISQDIYEAAEIDGASGWRIFFQIEFPLIMTQFRINLIMMTIGTLQNYGLLLILLGPGGGPNNVGMVPGLYMFRTGFMSQRFGYACAMGLIMFFIILFITILYQRFVRVEK